MLSNSEPTSETDFPRKEQYPFAHSISVNEEERERWLRHALFMHVVYKEHFPDMVSHLTQGTYV